MTTAYPAALDDFANPTPGQSQQAPRTHSQHHTDLNDAIEAVQAALGVSGSPNFPGQLRADLANGAADKGAALVEALQSGTGATSESLLDAYRSVVRPEQFGATGNGVADDAAALQKALNRAAGGVLKLTPGRTYSIETALEIDSNTILDARGATVVRSADIDNMIRNKADGVTGGYAANTNIQIIGGTWNCNGTNFATAASALAFGHCNRIKVIGARILDVPTFHHIEVNGVSDCEIAACLFSGGAEQAAVNIEAIQVDMNIDMSQFPWFGPADSTPCMNLYIHDNVFTNTGSGVGTHSSSGAIRHNNIRIYNNDFSGTYYAGVKALNWSDVKIVGNRFSDGFYGISALSAGTATCRTYLIEGNSFYDIGNTAYAAGGNAARGVFIQSSTTAAHYIRGYVIRGNAFLDFTATKAESGVVVNYSDRGVISGNNFKNINGAGINVFESVRVAITGNNAEQCNVAGTVTRAAGITIQGSASRGMASSSVVGNVTDTLIVYFVDKCLVTENVITTAAGLTETSPTNTYIARNLVDGVYAIARYSGSATYDPASLVDGAGVTTTVTVTGAAVGDLAQASFSQALQGVMLTAWVSAANTVSVRFQNETGGAVDLASGTLRAFVDRAQ